MSVLPLFLLKTRDLYQSCITMHDTSIYLAKASRRLLFTYWLRGKPLTTGLEINNSCGQGIDIGSIPESNKRWMGNTKEWITIMVYST